MPSLQPRSDAALTCSILRPESPYSGPPNLPPSLSWSKIGKTYYCTSWMICSRLKLTKRKMTLKINRRTPMIMAPVLRLNLKQHVSQMAMLKCLIIYPLVLSVLEEQDFLCHAAIALKKVATIDSPFT